jgi:hypothetical protein
MPKKPPYHVFEAKQSCSRAGNSTSEFDWLLRRQNITIKGFNKIQGEVKPQFATKLPTIQEDFHRRDGINRVSQK